MTINTTLLQDQSVIQSPYIPGTVIQFAWDSTSIGYAKTCPKLYEYIMIQGWQTKDEAIHLRFGIEYHSALEDYDRLRAEGAGHEEAVQYTVHELLKRTHDWRPSREEKAGKYKNENTILELVIDYLDFFNSEGTPDPAETIILDNGRPAVELSFRFELDFGPQHQGKYVEDSYHGGSIFQPTDSPFPYVLCGHLDRVVSFNGFNFVMDRKTTTTTLGDFYFNQYEPNNQMTLYTLAGKVVMNTPIKGVIIDAAQVKLREPHAFKRGWTYRTSGQLKEWLTDLRILFSTFEAYALAGHWPMNDTACDKFGGCKFRKICQKDPAVRERFLKAEFTKLSLEERWNPLKPR